MAQYGIGNLMGLIADVQKLLGLAHRHLDDINIKWTQEVDDVSIHISETPSEDPVESGGSILWAVITTTTDANNYVCSIWLSRGSYVNGDPAEETLMEVRVPDLVDTMAVGDGFPVVASDIAGEDYECIQQMGAVG